MIRKVVGGIAVLGALFAVEAHHANADMVKLKVGTAAAPDSPWGRVFKIWDKAIQSKTSQAYGLDFYFNQTQGSEVTMVDKMLAKQLDVVAVTSVGLGKIDKRLLALQVPGSIRSWKALDGVRTALGSEFEGYLNSKKVALVTWGDVGYAHFISKGFAVHTPDDLKGKNPWIYPDEPIQKAVFAKIGGVNPYPIDLMQVGTSVDTGKINCMSISLLAAEMLQWNSKFDNGVDDVEGIVAGAVVMSQERLDSLPADVKAAIVDTGHKMGDSSSGLKQLIRNEDDAAWKRFVGRSGVQIYKPTDADRAKWKTVFDATRTTLKAGTFDAGLVGRIESESAKY